MQEAPRTRSGAERSRSAMQTAWLLAGAIAFSVIAPGTIAGLIPYAITRWRVQSHWLGLPGRIAGGLMLAAGVLILVESFLRFVFVGRGTPAPVAPPEELVVSGFYRYSRNPMVRRGCSRYPGAGPALRKLKPAPVCGSHLAARLGIRHCLRGARTSAEVRRVI